jgi:hypothetical protein
MSYPPYADGLTDGLTLGETLGLRLGLALGDRLGLRLGDSDGLKLSTIPCWVSVVRRTFSSSIKVMR